jgi:predicted Fe-Mo cluster-binding NifX family protein
VRACVPVSADGQVDPRWGRAERVAVADVTAGEIRGWQEFTVGWGTLHDQGTEGAHHARVARFLRENQVQGIAVHHIGPGMQRMLASMSIRAVTGLGGDARSAARCRVTLTALGLPGPAPRARGARHAHLPRGVGSHLRAGAG